MFTIFMPSAAARVSPYGIPVSQRMRLNSPHSHADVMIIAVSLSCSAPLFQDTQAALLKGIKTTPEDGPQAALQKAAHDNDVEKFERHLSQGADVQAPNSAVSKSLSDCQVLSEYNLCPAKFQM